MHSLPVALFLWNPKPDLRAHLEAGLPMARCVFSGDKEGAAIPPLAAEAVAMVGWRATPELLDAAPRLRLFQCPGTGVRHLVDMFQGREAALCNGHGNAGLVAQHGVALLLAAANRLLPHHEEMRAGRWRDGGGPGDSIPLAGSVVGVAGTGAIGQRVAAMLAGFGCRVVGLSRQGRPASGFAQVWAADAKEGFFAAAEHLILCLPSTRATEGFVGARELAALAGGVVVNVGRGDAVDEAALYAALAAGRLAGAGIDTWPREAGLVEGIDGARRPFAEPFHELPNVVLSPHRAASPFGGLGRWADVLHNVRTAISGQGGFVNLVDLSLGY